MGAGHIGVKGADDALAQLYLSDEIEAVTLLRLLWTTEFVSYCNIHAVWRIEHHKNIAHFV